MSDHQVPEGIPSREQQLQDLDRKLREHATFQKMRGKFKNTLAEIVAAAITVGDTPTGASGRFDDYLAEVRVMLMLLARLKRDGHMHAYEELWRALSRPNYRMAGETNYGVETEPYTVFVLDPEIAFELYRLDAAETDAECFLDPEFVARASPALRQFITEAEPRPYYREVVIGGRWFEVYTKFSARRANIPCKAIGKRPSHFYPCTLDPSGKMEDRYRGHGRADRMRLTGNSHGVYGDAFAFGKIAEQSEILGAFNRADQHRIASWQFHLPRSVKAGGRTKQLVLCLIPESEFAPWQKERPLFASRSVNHGYGALIILPEDLTHLVGRLPPGCLIFDNRTRNSR